MNMHNWHFSELEATRRQAELLAEAKQRRLAKLAQMPRVSLIQRFLAWLKPDSVAARKTRRKTRLQNSRPAYRL